MVENIEKHLIKHGFGPLPDSFDVCDWCYSEFDFDPGTNTREFIYNALQYKYAMYDELKRVHQLIGHCEAHQFESLRTSERMVYKCKPDDSTVFYLRIEDPYVLDGGSIYRVQYTVSIMTALQGMIEKITVAEFFGRQSERGYEVAKWHHNSNLNSKNFSDIIALQIEKFGLPVYKTLRYLMNYDTWSKSISNELTLDSTSPEFHNIPDAVRSGDLTYERVLECIEDFDDMTLTIAGCNQFSTLMFVMHGIFETINNTHATYLPRTYNIENLLDYCHEARNKRKT